MRIAVTGATGNIGTAVVRRLLAEGAHEVVGVARRPPAAGTDDATWVVADVSRDDCVPALERAFEGVDAVVHTVWGFQPSHDLGYLEELGVGGTRRVLDATAAAGVPQLVHLSSVGAYSPKVDDRPVDESYPTDGVAGSPYSRHKVAAERLLDAHEANGGGPRIARVRPGIVVQGPAASALLRYGLPGFVPARAIALLPVLPLDRGVVIPMVHADDVAAAIERIVLTGAGGAFNLASDPPMTADRIAHVLRARHVHVPGGVLRAAVDLSWRAHLQQVDPGWVALALNVPVLDTTRAREELGWAPAVPADCALREAVEAMADGAAGATPALRRRTLGGRVSDLVHRGPVSRRHRP
jgi:UDP-glucose 4-epimerase